ncbi:MAG: tRNA uridine-5-carboxymethylaminomethyl(34) synthesis enzyme MnmG, partial [Octadecabacter sp.]|nr:tRNA uridine-5-carboxymethylaminomethyl(34) synthesis enzyme MnmG [Octadecabacter sp.]
LIVTNHTIAGVRLTDESVVTASAVVLTTGTFLNGVIHIGDESFPAGRMGNKSSLPLAARMADLGLALGRLKTGTPPRLRRSSIDWDTLEKQPADEDPVMFSFLSQCPFVQQVDCAITHTNTQTHEIIQENLHRSAMYGGIIEGAGPRYCPSIEDKVVRFSDKPSHQVFLEPEGLDSDVVYPNGISTSLPQDVQDRYVRSMVGLKKVDILQPGYAIEYDFIDPRCLDSTLHLEQVPGLFLAGQINGTTGYEEAAAQGLIAGLNASCRVQGEDKVTLGRNEAYIGVMIDDLVTRGVTEPYRMFTSRAEYRLTLRADNADQRLTPLAENLQILSPERVAAFGKKMEQIQKGHHLLAQSMFTPQQARAAGVRVNQDGKKRSAFDLLGFPDVTAVSLEKLVPEVASMLDDILRQLEIEATYAVYEERQKAFIAGVQRDENVRIPTDFNFQNLSGLSNELKGKLAHIRPETLGQAGRIEGMTPAALALILTRVRVKEKRTA